MKRILPFLLFLFLAIALTGQRIEALEQAWLNTNEELQKLKYGERLAEKLMTKNPEQAILYASEAFQLAEGIDNSKHLAITAYLLGKIHIRQQDRTQAIEQFKIALAFAKRNDDTHFAYRSIKKLIYLLKKDRKYNLALGYAEEGLKLLYEAKKVEVESTSEALPIVQEPQNQPKEELLEIQKEKDRLKEEIASLMLEREEQFSFDMKESKAQPAVIQERSIPISNGRSSSWWPLALSFVSLLLGGFLFLRFRENKIAKTLIAEKNRIIEEERNRAEELLLNIVPPTVAKDIKEHKKTIAKKYDFTTVLFADFKNFAQVSKQLEPDQLVTALDHCFKAFDKIISKYDNIEKIKTLGDTYLCATGLTTRETAPVNLVQAALEMQDFLNGFKKEKMARSEPFFEARIGIHTGEVVAGVVGAKKFAYDIFGETVNIAAQMQEHCATGKVNLSAETYRLVKYSFDCMISGKVELEEGQTIDMYYVHPEQEEVIEEEEVLIESD